MRPLSIGPQDALPDLENCYDELLQIIGRNYPSVPWELAKAVMRQESFFNPLAVSPTGPKGLFQFARATWADYNPDDHTGRLRTDIYRSALTAFRHLADLVAWAVRHGMVGADIARLALAAYNQGQGRVLAALQWAQAQGADPTQWFNVLAGLEATLPPENYREAKGYVEAIMKFWDAYAPTRTDEVQA